MSTDTAIDPNAYPRPAYAELPEVDVSDLLTVGPGLYRVIGPPRIGDVYRPETDTFEKGVRLGKVARVDADKTELPKGVERAEIRPDGCRLIVGEVIIP